MGFFSDMFGGGDDRLPEERAVDREQHRAYRKALGQNGEWERKHGHREESPTYWQLNSAVIESERDVPWWRR